MRWPIHWFFVISLALPIKADTERPKRDLNTLLNIKRSLISKIFGDSCTDCFKKSTSNSIKLFKIPGHDNILVKATPRKVKNPEKVVEVTHEFAANPTMALLQSYLGTKTSEETLIALERVKTLLASGVISDTVALEKLLVPKAPNIKYQIPTPLDIVNPIYPTIFQVPLELPSKSFASYEKAVKGSGVSYVIPTISDLPRNSYGVPLPGSVVFSQERPFSFPETLSLTQPILPPGIIVPEVIAPAPPITFELPQLAITEFKPVEEKIIETPVVPSSYSYHQIHNDGSVTTTFTTDIKRLKPDLVRPIVERTKQISEEISDLSKPVKNLPGVFLPDVPGPVEIQDILKEESLGGFSYHQVQDDDSVTTITDGGIQNPVPLSYVGKEKPVVQSVIFDDSPKPVVEPVSLKLSRLIKRPDGKGGFFYERISDDETITSISDIDGKKPLPLNDSGNIKPLPTTHNILLNRIGQIAEKMAIPEAPKLSTLLHNSEISSEKDQESNKGPSSSGYSYQQINSDGSVITYTGSEKPYNFTQVSDNSKITAAPPSSKRPEPDLVRPIVERIEQISEKISDISKPVENIPGVFLPDILGPVQIQGIQKKISPGGFSYHQVEDDDSVTTLTNSGTQNIVPHFYVSKDIPVFQSVTVDDLPKPFVIPVSRKLSRLIKRPDGKGGFVYECINDDETITTFSEIDGRKPLLLYDSGEVKSVPIIHNIVLNRIGQIAETINIPEALKLSTLLHNTETSTKKYQEINKSPSSSGYSYQQINNDGSVTTYSGSEKLYNFTQESDSSKITGAPPSVTLPEPHPPVVEPQGPKPYLVFLEGDDWYESLIGSAPALPLTEVQKVWLPKNRPVDVHKISTTSNNRFSYQQITSDGSAITNNLGNKHFVSVASPVSFVPGSPATTYGVPFSGPASGVETKPFVSELSKDSLPVFRPVHVEPIAPTNSFIFQQILNNGSTAIYTGAGKIERPNKVTDSKISPRPYFSTPPGSPHLPPPTVSFATPVVTSYMYKQIVPNNQNFTEVNGDHGFSHPKDSTSHTADITQSAEAQYSIDRRVSTATKVGKSKPHGADHEQLNVVVQKASTNIHTASGSFKYVQHNDISSENSVNEQNEVTKTPRNSSDTSEGTFKNHPIVVSEATASKANLSFDDVKGASENVHRGDIP